MHHHAVTKTVSPKVTVIHRGHEPVLTHCVLCIRTQSPDSGPGDIIDVTTSHHVAATSSHTESLLLDTLCSSFLEPPAQPHRVPSPARRLPPRFLSVLGVCPWH